MPAATAGLAARMAAKNKEERKEQKKIKRQKAQIAAQGELAELEAIAHANSLASSGQLEDGDDMSIGSSLSLDVDSRDRPFDESTPLPGDDSAGRTPFSFADLGVDVEGDLDAPPPQVPLQMKLSSGLANESQHVLGKLSKAKDDAVSNLESGLEKAKQARALEGLLSLNREKKDWANDYRLYKHNPPVRAYLKFCDVLRVNFAEAEWFSNFILFCIITAGVMVGIMVGYPNMAENPTANALDNLVSFIFLCEVVIKTIGEGKRYQPPCYY
mmetsp:Transcript_45488/g.125610  ORF Transcript_45488/g.125610 Transcript_45488/m.125610 type:complete len:271 (-) Transcript_45488:1883-2695(-)